MAVEPLFLNPRGGADDGYVVAVDHSPFTVGRRPDNDLELAEAAVSGRHAELRYEAGVWLVVDLGSRNGTFLNGQRVEHPSRVNLGDILHIATRGFQVVPGQPSDDESIDSTILAESASDVRGVVELLNIIEERRTYPYFQPIVNLASEKTIGFEALGRATTSDGSVELAKLFRLADKTNVETALSTCFRESAWACAGCRHCWSSDDRLLTLLERPSDGDPRPGLHADSGSARAIGVAADGTGSSSSCPKPGSATPSRFVASPNGFASSASSWPTTISVWVSHACPTSSPCPRIS